jgi:hypothetical protein
MFMVALFGRKIDSKDWRGSRRTGYDWEWKESTGTDMSGLASQMGIVFSGTLGAMGL